MSSGKTVQKVLLNLPPLDSLLLIALSMSWMTHHVQLVINFNDNLEHKEVGGCIWPAPDHMIWQSKLDNLLTGAKHGNAGTALSTTWTLTEDIQLQFDDQTSASCVTMIKIKLTHWIANQCSSTNIVHHHQPNSEWHWGCSLTTGQNLGTNCCPCF